MSKLKEGFFSVSISCFEAITEDLGMNECCLYLIYCCGTGKSNVTTRWSVNALHKYTRIGVRRGVKSASLLREFGFVTQTRGGKHPIHEIERDPDHECVWLPKSFVMGVANEDSPLERIRQTDDQLALRLCVNLYWRCDIASDGGVDQSCASVTYKRTLLTTHNQFNVFGFKNGAIEFVPNDLHTPHVDETHTNKYQPFWDRLKLLEDIGLIYECPTLFDSVGGEPICPLINPFTELPITDITDLASQVKPDWFDQCLDAYDFTPLVPKHYRSVVLRGVYILRYRQQTAKTASGYAATMERIDDYMKCLYQGGIKEVSMIDQGGIKAVSRIDQGGFKDNIKERSSMVGDELLVTDLEQVQKQKQSFRAGSTLTVIRTQDRMTGGGW